MWPARLLVLLVPLATAAYVDRGFLFVAPKVWRAGTAERVCVTLFNMAADPALSRRYTLGEALRLLRRGGRLLSERVAAPTASSAAMLVKVEFADSRGGRRHGFRAQRTLGKVPMECFVINVPDSLKARYIAVTVGGTRKFTQWSEIVVQPRTLVTLVQTDKAKYRPGQTVRLRVISLRHDLTALSDPIREIWITTPEGTRLAQWLDVKLNTGLVQKEFTLTEEPPLGQWSIHVKRADGAVTVQPFVVEEFVPPRFEVALTTLGTVYSDSNTVTVRVCAKYTFGKPLASADVLLYISTSRPHVFRSSGKEQLRTEVTRISVPTRPRRAFGDAIGLPSTAGHALQVGATVTGDGTRISEAVRDSMVATRLTDRIGRIPADDLTARSGLISATNATTTRLLSSTKTRRKRAVGVSQANSYFDKTGGDGCTTLDVNLNRARESGGLYHPSKFLVVVNVTESGTDIVQTEEMVVPVRQSKLLKIISSDSPKFFKPGLEYYGTARFENPDGTPWKGQRVEICYTSAWYQENPATSTSGSLPFVVQDVKTTSRPEKCSIYRTDGSGRIVYIVPPQNGYISSLSFKGRTIDKGQRFALPAVHAWYSPSNSYLMIDAQELLGGGLCGGTVSVAVHRSAGLSQLPLQYMILSRGDVVEDGVLTAGRLSFTLRSELSPSFKLLVFAVTADGEVVADSKLLRLDPCLPNKVAVSWSRSQVRPGQSASLSVSAAPGSLCGVAAVDRSAELLGSSNAVSPQRVFAQLERLVIRETALPRLGRPAGSGYCRPTRTVTASGAAACPRHGPVGISRFGRYRHPYSVTEIRYKMDKRDDSMAAFDMAGYLAVTNLALQTRPCIEEKRTITKYSTCYISGPVIKDRVGSETRRVASTASDSARGASVESGNTISARSDVSLGGVLMTAGSSVRPAAGPVLRSEKDLAADTVVRASSGTVQTTAESKSHSEATSLGTTVETSTGNGAKEVPLEPRVRSYFPETFVFQMEALGDSGTNSLNLQLPDSITRWIGSAVCSHYKTGFGISPPSSIKTFKPFFAEINVPYSVKRGELLQLKVSVFNFLSSGLSVVLQLENTPGLTLDAGVSGRRVLCVRADRPAVQTFPLVFSRLGRVSVAVSVRAEGDACGEANGIGPQSDALVRDVLVKPEGFPQEETLSERICPDDSGADVTHVFELATSPRVVPDSARAVVSIFGDPLAEAITQVSGLESLVRVPHGCGEQNMVLLVPNILVRQYLEARKLLSDDLKKRTTDNMLSGYQRQLRYRHRDGSYSAFGERYGRSQGSLWLTAYVIKSLAAAARYVPIDAADLASSRRWVERQQRADGCFSTVGWLYNSAMSGGVAGGGRLPLTAFTLLALVETGANGEIVRRAVACLRRGTPRGLYAEALVAHALGVAERSAAAALLPPLVGRGLRADGGLYWRSERGGRWRGGAALDVEITGYMVMTLLRLSGHAADARAAVAWLDRQRNGRGGFVSTQDTVVALAALVAAETQASKLSQLGLDVRVRAGAKFSRQFRVTSENRLLHQQAELRPLRLPASVAVTASGRGCVVAQTTMKYSLQESKAKLAFKIQHKLRPLRSGSCQSFVLELCTSYLQDGTASNMAIIEVEMLSGFVVVDYVLQQLERSGVIRRWEFHNSVLSMYFDQFVEKPVCFDLRMLRDTVVDRLKPATIAVYDYYTTEQRLETEYVLPDCKI